MTPLPRLHGLYRYPLKSGAAQTCDALPVQARGLAEDRRWMVCDPQGRFLTGRSHPRLSLIQAWPQPWGLQLRAPGMAALDLALTALVEPREVQVWKQTVPAMGGAGEADAWFSAYLDQACTLVWMPDSSHRPVDPRYARAGDEVSFADGYPLLLLGQASLDALNQRLSQPVEARHFRPNLVIEGTVAHAEDTWRRLRIGAVEFEVAKPCSRCIFVNVDPHTGRPSGDGEPLRTLATYRRSDQGICFGQNLIARSSGILRLGDPVQVIA